MTNKSQKLRALLQSNELEFIMEAHNGLSARIVERAGFQGIWASGLALSAQFGVRDSNEASWTQVLEMLELMSDATDIPILLDGDSGYGDFNNLRRLVRKLEQRRIAGVCIEDKPFPKRNSFIDSERQPLAEIDELCGKIKAAKDTQADPDFCLVARTEALLAGWGQDEALRRAEAYHEAGADAILIHSKRAGPEEILEFAGHWGSRCPLIIVPTTYSSTPAEVFERAGISLVIWANHMVRASIAAMERASRTIRDERGVAGVEHGIATVKDVFELQNAEELTRAEHHYLAAGAAAPSAIVLDTLRGRPSRSADTPAPDVMTPVDGKPVLRRLVDTFKRRAIHSTCVVSHQPARIQMGGIRVLTNEQEASFGELAALLQARSAYQRDAIITRGNLLFRDYILQDLLAAEGELVMTVDSSAPPGDGGGAPDRVRCSREDDNSPLPRPVALLGVGEAGACVPAAPGGRWIGLLRARERGLRWIDEALAELKLRDDFAKLNLEDLLSHLVDKGRLVTVHYIRGHWLAVEPSAHSSRAARIAT